MPNTEHESIRETSNRQNIEIEWLNANNTVETHSEGQIEIRCNNQSEVHNQIEEGNDEHERETKMTNKIRYK